MDAETFRRDVKTQSAVVFQLLVIGEATKRLSAEVRDRLPVVPWSDIARMRDRMIHHYEGIDVDEVWRTASQDVPRLLEAIEPLLPHGE